MTAVEAVIQTTIDVVALLKKADLIEGESLGSREEVEATTGVIFWHALAKNGGGNKETYLVWNVMPADPVIWADDKPGRRRATAVLDLFTRYSINDLTVQDTMKKINSQAVQDGWNCEMFEAPSYDPEFQRTRLALQLSKLMS